MLFKRLAFVFYFALLVFLFSNSVLAQDYEWIKNINPVIPHGLLGAWDSRGRLAPAVIFDDGIYKMWFVGTNGVNSEIGYATSSDGIDWNISENPVLTYQPPDEKGLSELSVLHDGDVYKMWVTVVLANGKYVIDYATSGDGISWERRFDPVLEGDLWESNQIVAAPSVIKIDDVYHMFYNGNDGKWKIGHATSSAGLNWHKHPTPVIIATESWEGNDVGRPSAIYYDGSFEIYYHAGSPTSIGHATSTDGIGWNKLDDNPIISLGPNEFDSVIINAPYVIYKSGVFHMWYSGYDGHDWSIGYAKSGEESNLNPVVFIPGTFASWNSQALLKGESVNQTDWILNPLVKEYDGIIETLKSLGYDDDSNSSSQNLFVFNYDWRKRVEGIAEDLNSFVNTQVKPKSPGRKDIYVVGHSLGGLAGRTYLQNFDPEGIEQLITIGSPHSGALLAYKAWSGGEIEYANSWERFVFEILMGVNRKGFRSNKDIVREIMPSAHDMLPTFDYLIDKKTGSVKPVNTMADQNEWLNDLETDFPNIFENYTSMYGSDIDTSRFYKVVKPNLVDNLLGVWKEGKPVETVYSNLGDGLILDLSATRSADPAILLTDSDHGEIVKSEEAISKLVEILGLETEEIIAGGTTTFNFPALFFALYSPTQLTVYGPGGTYPSSDGYVIIPNAVNGNYTIEVKGTGTGVYKVLIGEITETDSDWQEIVGNTVPDKLDQFPYVFNASNLENSEVTDISGDFYLNNALAKLILLKEKHPHWTLDLAISALNKAQSAKGENKYDQVRSNLQKVITYLSSYRKKINDIEAQNSAYEVMEDLGEAYGRLPGTFTKVLISKLSADMAAVELLKIATEKKLELKGKEYGASAFELAINEQSQGQNDFNNGLYWYAQIEIFTAKLLYGEAGS